VKLCGRGADCFADLSNQLMKWGDSLAVRLPKALVEKMGLNAGDELNIVDVVDRTLFVQKEDRRKALERLGSLNWTFLPTTSSIGARRTSGEFEATVCPPVTTSPQH
jgi:antitoxin MazE